MLPFVIAALAAAAAGFVNALAGGGTLISFPMLTFVGVPPVAANVTNTVALCPGYLGATLAPVSSKLSEGLSPKPVRRATVAG